MAFLSKDDDSNFWNTVTPRIGAEVKFSLRTCDLSVADFRRNVAVTELTNEWAAAKTEARRLSNEQIFGPSRP
jgi:hypothetical protein